MSVAAAHTTQLALLLLLTAPTIRLLVDCAYMRLESASVRRGADITSGRKSLFGYTIAVVKDSGVTHLLVSDPVAASRVTGQGGGAVYKCEIRASDFNTTGSICRNSELPFNYTNSTDREVHRDVSQFGASMSALPTGQFVVCAPGYNFATLYNQTATPGLCAYWDSVRSAPRWLDKIFPYITMDKTDRMFGNCMGGFQAQLLPPGPDTGGSPRLAVSGPFCMLRRLALVLPTRKDVKFMHSEAHDYMGYSLAAGPHTNSTTLYATLPHTNIHNYGISLLARVQTAGGGVDTRNAQRIVMRHDNPYSEDFRRSFNFIGYSSATVRTDGPSSRKSALILGAPFHSDASEPDRGCVFVLPVDPDNTEDTTAIVGTPVHYCGSDIGGSLGTSVVSLGDINHDGSDDFAVGCPRCGVNKTGAVYLFFGLRNSQLSGGKKDPGRVLEPFEVVHAANVSSDLSGFGWSLATADDIDGNGAGELVVGAVTSGHVVVLPGKILLDTSIDVAYADGSDPQTLISMSEFHDTAKKTFLVTITMTAGPEINLADYGFDLQVRLAEFAEEVQYRRFEMDMLGLESIGEGWHQLSRVHSRQNQAVFPFNFKMKVLSNIQRHIPVIKLLRDMNLLVQWRILNRSVPSGKPFPFPAVLHKNRVFPGYEDDFMVKLFGFRDAVCANQFCRAKGNIKLTLLNASTVMLNSFQSITVALSVEKSSSEPFYGGAAIQVDLSSGVFVMGTVTLQQQNGNVTEVNYWSEHKEVLVTEPYPDVPDLLTRSGRGKLTAFIRLKFDGRHANYRVGFNLVNVMAKEGYQKYVTEDDRPQDNNASMEIAFNTSLLLNLFPRTDEFTIVDSRPRPDEAALLALKQVVRGDVVGPSLQHIYELFAVSNPMIPVHNLLLTVRVPFVTADKKLLLYFPRSSIGSSTRLTGNQYQPGLPFLSDDLEGFVENSEHECQPVENDLADLLFKPDLKLLETRHQRVNVSDSRVRRDVGSSPMLDRSNATSGVSLATSGAAASVPAGGGAEAVPVFDCDQPDLAPFPFRCLTFRCSVRTMIQNGSTGTADKVFLHVHAKVWPPTFFAAHRDRFSVKSSVSLAWIRSPAFKYIDVADNSSVQQTFLFLDIKPPMVDKIPWGYIVLAIFLGIWLLLLFILLLWYCNFFRRTKFEYEAVPRGEAAASAAAGGDDFYR